MKEINEEKLFDLLSQKALYGLNDNELEELKELEKSFPEWQGDNSFEIAATAINLGNIDTSEPMPSHLRAKILTSADEFFGKSKGKQELTSFAPEEEKEANLYTPVMSLEPQTTFWQKLGWGVAAFACIALAVNLYLTRINPQPEIVQKPVATQTPAPQLNDEQKREQLLASADTVKLDIDKADPKKEGEISGDIVWNNDEQKGYVRVRGLPVNDPNKETYQLWIFDDTQDEKYPIDAGVFDVNKDGEVLIPMDAKLKVKKPKMIAITKEKPGGVVVSDRKGIVAIAKV